MTGAVVATLVAACYSGPKAAHFVAVIEELAISPEWTLELSSADGPDEDEDCSPNITWSCPRATRVYTSERDALDLVNDAEQIVGASGFAVDEEFSTRDCDLPASGPSCAFVAVRGSDQLVVSIFRRTHEAGLPDQNRLGVTAISLSAHRADEWRDDNSQ